MYGNVSKTHVNLKSDYFKGWSTNKKYSFIKSCYKIARVFTDDIVNMWSVDYLDGLKRDYKSYDDLPCTLQAYVQYCKYEGFVKNIGHHTTSYSTEGIFTFEKLAQFTSFTK